MLRRALRYLYAQGDNHDRPKHGCSQTPILQESKNTFRLLERRDRAYGQQHRQGKPERQKGLRTDPFFLSRSAGPSGIGYKANLTFSSFNWDKNIIEVAQQKTGEPVTLPLLNDVGEAVIDYIRYARPKSDVPFLFLKLNALNDVMYANSITSHGLYKAERGGNPHTTGVRNTVPTR